MKSTFDILKLLFVLPFLTGIGHACNLEKDTNLNIKKRPFDEQLSSSKYLKLPNKKVNTSTTKKTNYKTKEIEIKNKREPKLLILRSNANIKFFVKQENKFLDKTKKLNMIRSINQNTLDLKNLTNDQKLNISLESDRLKSILLDEQLLNLLSFNNNKSDFMKDFFNILVKRHTIFNQAKDLLSANCTGWFSLTMPSQMTFLLNLSFKTDIVSLLNDVTQKILASHSLATKLDSSNINCHYQSAFFNLFNTSNSSIWVEDIVQSINCFYQAVCSENLQPSVNLDLDNFQQEENRLNILSPLENIDDIFPLFS